MVNSNEFIELIEMDKNVYCCICLNTDVNRQVTLPSNDLQFNYPDFIKMDCCNQQIHKNCFLDWIIHPIKTNKKYDNKFHCIICKTKIVNLQNTIPIGDFINFIENTKPISLTATMPLLLKKIISELYKDSVITNMFKSDDTKRDTKRDTDLKYFFYNVCFIFIFLIMIFVFIFIINLL